jgi:hypothetical protein
VIVVPEGPVEVGRLRIVSYLGEATELVQGTHVLELVLSGTSGGAEVQQRFALRAGVETAEWAYGRPDVRARARHGQAPVALRTRLIDPVAGAFEVYEYLAELDLQRVELHALSIRSLAAGVTAYVQQIWAEPAGELPYHVSPGRIENVAYMPRLWLSLPGGAASTVSDAPDSILADEPEVIAVRVAARQAATLVVADTFYPGWRATVDGQEAELLPIAGFFRGVPVPAGEHEVTLRYDPLSFKIGVGLSGAGLVILGVLLAHAWRRGPNRAVVL